MTLALMLALASGARCEPVAFSLVESSSPASQVVAVARRGGALGFLGHDHAVLARDWQAQIEYDEKQPKDSSFLLIIPAASLEVDTDYARKAAGLGRGPKPKEVPEIRKRMLGPEVLDADHFPQIRFVSLTVTVTDTANGRPKELAVWGRLTLHGVTHEEKARVTLEPGPDGEFAATGSLTILQSDYGIEPISIVGVVKVKDEVELSVALRPGRG